MNQVIRTFCEEKNIRFGQGYADGMEDFFAIDGNGIFLIYGRPIVGATQGEVVVRGDATRYLSELVARLDRNDNTVRVNGNTLSVVFKLRTPMGYGVPRRIPTPPTPPTPSGNYLYFEAKQANSTVSMISMLTTAPNIEYSEDGDTWVSWDSTQQDIGGGTIAWVFDTITLENIGDKVYFCGTNAALSEAPSKITVFSPTGNVKVGGSVQSLVDSTGDSTTAIEMSSLFADMLGSEALTEVDSELLPATTLKEWCYSGMFNGCNKIVTAPTLHVATLVDYCYSNMFADCSLLTSVTCLATDISAQYCLNTWLDNTAESGTLYKDPSMTGWVEGTNYPSGWTLTDYAG